MVLPGSQHHTKNAIEAFEQTQQSACCWLAEEGSRESVDAKCRRLTATWVRERHVSDQDIEVCDFFEQLERAGTLDSILLHNAVVQQLLLRH